MSYLNTPDNTAAHSKVLFTGDWERMIDNVLPHIPAQFDMKRCLANAFDIEKAVRTFAPEIIVVCLAGTSPEGVRPYYALSEHPQYASIPVIVLGHQEDCDLFQMRVFCKHITLMPRPVDLDHLWVTIREQLELSRTRQGAKGKVEAEAASTEAPAAPIPQPQADAQTQSQMQPTPASLTDVDKEVLQRAQKFTRMGGRKSVLVVDDDVTMLNTIKMYLQDLYDVTIVPSGKLALKFLEKKSADLVLLDYMMPEMEGPEVLRLIRRGSQPNIPVLFLTGVSDKESVMRGLEYNPNGYLLKPTSRQILLERVMGILLGLD